MRTSNRSASRRRTQRSRAERIAVPLAIPVALGLTLGIVIAVTSGSGSAKIEQSALGGVASPSASASATATTPASTTVLTAGTFASGPLAQSKLGDVANAPVSGAAGATPINLNQTAAEALVSMNCTLAVPKNPLTAKGLATPWQLGDGCSMANAATEGAFVEATIVSPAGAVQVYNPLVITAGTTAAVTPTAPTIAPGSAVIIDVGFNGTNLALTGPGVNEGRCIDALGQSLIGQVSACNAVKFYKQVDAMIANGTLTVPPVGTSLDGQSCLVTRSFAVIDQDQSDNVDSTYLFNAATGTTEQDTAANAAADTTATPVVNGSDDKLLDSFLDPANGCTPFTATDTTDAAGTSGSQALNELSAVKNAPTTIAEIPVNDEMVLVDGNFSVAKDNVYRSLVDQGLLAQNVNTTAVAADYCQNMTNLQPERNQLDMTRELNFGTPVAAVGDNLATFMGNRLSMSFVNLNCANFGLTNPVNVTLNGNGVAIAVSYNLTQQVAKAPTSGTTVNPTAGQTQGTQARGHRHGRGQNPSGM